jgi:hypothetical protein
MPFDMRCTWRILTLAVLLSGLPWLAQADWGPDELEHNRRLLEKWRSNPEHDARLRRDLKAYLALPYDRQQQLRTLDHELSDEDSTGYARLQRAIERYADWLRNLPEADREQILTATSAEERLKRIREIRQRQWVEQLPRATREKLHKLQADPSKYQAELAELKKQEQKWRHEWRYAIEHWDALPATRPQAELVKELIPQIDQFVRESLAPMLGPAEKTRLENAHKARESGRWFFYLSTIADLADKHPVRLPPAARIGPTRFKELPDTWQARVLEAQNWPPQPVVTAEGKWPDYAFAVHRFVFNKEKPARLPKPPLGPATPAEFTPAVQQFIKEKLLPMLTTEERGQLTRAMGRWPGYPNLLMNLARKHSLEVPGTKLPGSPEIWNQFRVRKTAAEASPEVPDRVLRDFLQKDLTPLERAELTSLSLEDPNSRQQVLQLYFKRNPDELRRLRLRDQKRPMQPGMKK